MIDSSIITSLKDSVFLVTGGAGFIGSNLCDYLVKHGAIVRCLDNFSYGSKENVSHLLKHKNFTLIEGDILDMGVCKTSMQGVDYVLHQAALGSVPRSFEYPQDYMEVNIMGSINLLEASRLNNVKRFVYASSSSVYGDSEDLPKVESNIGNAISPYALSKRIFEEIAYGYSHLYPIITVGLRYFNIYGPRQDFSRQYPAVIASFITKALKNEPLIVHGDGTQSRDFTFVEDVIQANLLSCFSDLPLKSNVYNVASAKEYSLNQVIQLIEEVIIQKLPIDYKPIRQGDIKHSLASIAKANDELKYQPKFTLKQGIQTTMNYYRDKER